MTAAIPRPDKTDKTASGGAKPLEVVVVTHYYAEHGGGIELVADRLIREISLDPAMHFTWFASDCDAAPIIEGQAAQPMRSFNFLEKTLGIPWPLWGWRSLGKLRQAIKKADVVWLHDSLYLGNILAMRAARRARKPVVITQHIAPIPYRNPLLRLAMQWADALITRRMLRNADDVVFVSDRVAEDYYRRVRFSRPIKVVPNGVDVRVFYPPIAENRRFLRQSFALKNEQPVLLFVGRFVEKKGLEVIRRLAGLLPEYRFWLAGSGPINPDAWLLPNVHVLKGRKGPTLAELYQAADLLIIPSFGEGFPLVIQEAMACGLPVLCGPSTAQGNIPATPHLHIADLWPHDPERTAAVWVEKIRSFPVRLPLATPQARLAEFAMLNWDWPPIARVYAGVLKKYAPLSKEGA